MAELNRHPWDAPAPGTYLPMESLKDGYLYHISARNNYLGIWHSRYRAFALARKKWGELFLAFEYHWDTGEPHGTAIPWDELEKMPDHFKMLEKDIEYASENEKLVLQWLIDAQGRHK